MSYHESRVQRRVGDVDRNYVLFKLTYITEAVDNIEHPSHSQWPVKGYGVARP